MSKLNEEIIRRPIINPPKECNQCNSIYLDDRFVPGYPEASDSPAQIEINKVNRKICHEDCIHNTVAEYVPIPIASVKVIGGKTKTKKRSKKRGKKSKSIKKIFRRIKKK